MRKYLGDITVGAALLLLAGNYTDKFEEYDTDQYQIHDAGPTTPMKSMIETIVSIQQNDSQMQNQMVGQLGGCLCCSNTWSSTNFSTFNQSDAWDATPWNTPFEKIYGSFFQIQEAANSAGHYYAFACMMRAITILRVTGCYGPMPYSQVKKGNFYVSYDTQEQVYTSISDDLANAADVLYNYYVEANSNIPLGANDPVLNGDYSGWTKLASSMCLRVAIRINGTWPGIAQEAAGAAVTHKAKLIESNSDDAVLSCDTQSNPYQLATVSWDDLRVNTNIVDYMNTYDDPRMPKFFNKSTLAGRTDKYAGMRTGDTDFKKTDTAGFSIPAYTATSKLVVSCAAETVFLRAKGKLRGWNVGSETTEACYEDGINLSMKQYQVSATEHLKIDEAPVVSHESNAVQNATATTTNAVSVMWDDSKADNVDGKNFQRAITQKWVTNYPLRSEAWAEYRHTGYPKLYPYIDNLSDCGVSGQHGMRRLNFPYTEAQSNKANYDLGIVELDGAGNEAIDLRWAKKS